MGPVISHRRIICDIESDLGLFVHNMSMSFLQKLKGLFGPKEQLSADEMLRETLKQHGDVHSKPRQVDHFAYFNTDHEAAAYMIFVQERGYTLETTEQENAVAFYKVSPVEGEEFDQQLAILIAKASELNGDYDGWACPVTK